MKPTTEVIRWRPLPGMYLILEPDFRVASFWMNRCQRGGAGTSEFWHRHAFQPETRHRASALGRSGLRFTRRVDLSVGVMLPFYRVLNVWFRHSF